jgi:hypothetical protein
VSKSKKPVVQDAEANKQENAATDKTIVPTVAVSVQAATEPQQPQEPAKPDVVSIVDIIKGIPEEKAQMAEDLGVPVRPILKWMYQTEMQQKEILGFLQQLGAKLQTSAPNAPQQLALAPQQQNPGLGGLLQLLPQFLGQGAGQLSPGDMYFMEMGREMASLGTFMTKEMMKRMMPTAFADWEKTIIPK